MTRFSITLLLSIWAGPATAGPASTSSTTLVRAKSAAGIPAATGYANAKKALARGRPAEALAALKKSKDPLLEDRRSLLAGDALLALGQKKEAEKAYLLAHEQAELRAVKDRAARALINLYQQMRRWDDQLRSIDELLARRKVPNKPSLLLERAVVLERLKRRDESAELAWRILVDYPAGKVAEQAETLLERLKKKGAKSPTLSTRLALARAKNLVRAGAFDEAAEAFDALEEANPRLQQELAMERAEMYRRRGKKALEQEILERVYRAGLDESSGPEILHRMGRLSMSRDDNEGAIKFFDELARRFPKSKEAPEAQFLAAWLPYNDGDYATASERFLKFSQEYEAWNRRPEALWFAGWSAFLGKQLPLARRAFDQLLEEHPTSDMVLWAHYWTGRIRERSGDSAGAKASYRDVLRIAPLSYFGQWSVQRLNALGDKIAMVPTKEKGRAKIDEVLELLGPDRPITVDRAISLHAAGVTDEALEELHAAHGSLRRVRNTRGRVMIAEMLDRLGAHYEAFRLAMSITQGGGDLLRGEPYAWRAWRLAYPKAFWEDVQAAAKIHDVDPFLVLSLMRTESHFRPYVRSRVGARGLMQIMPATARRIGKVAEGGRRHAARFRIPESNIWLGTWYIKRLLERYDGQVALAVGAYNAGPRAMDRWMRDGAGRELDEFVEFLSYKETRRYIRRVLETYSIYKRLEGDGILPLGEVVRLVDPVEGGVSF